MYKRIEPNGFVSEKLNKESDGALERYSEMTQFQRAFLCGLLQENKPKKILEIGVAAGGTTAVILDCMNELNLCGEMVSVDISTNWYRGGNKQTGFLKDQLIKECKTQHKFMLGKAIPYVIDEIGDGIDFLILDTTHAMPGELLDFLVCYPYLTKNCIVVLHDVIENMLTGRQWEISTKLLFDIIDADKYYMTDMDIYTYGLTNIAAFRLSADSHTNIKNIFSALTYTWAYELGKDEKAYLEIIQQHYSEELVDWFKKILSMQSYMNIKDKVAAHYGRNIGILEMQWRHAKRIYIYGAGYWADIYSLYAVQNGFPISGYIVSDEQEITDTAIAKKYELPIFHLKDVNDLNSDCGIVLALDAIHFNQCILNLNRKGFYRIF